MAAGLVVLLVAVAIGAAVLVWYLQAQRIKDIAAVAQRLDRGDGRGAGNVRLGPAPAGDPGVQPSAS